MHNTVLASFWIALLCSFEACHSCYQVYPSEYAFLDSSVTMFERASCRSYPQMFIKASLNAQDYTNCSGINLLLTNNDLGSEQYSSSDYYVWLAGSSASQLLFIFSTRVNLTTITLHYYSDNLSGLSRLRFYAVPDEFEVWNAPSTSYSFVNTANMPPDGRLAGRRNVSTNLSFTTKKVILYKYSNSLKFAVSEVQFFFCFDSMDTFNSDESADVTITPQHKFQTVLYHGASEYTSDTTESTHTTMKSTTKHLSTNLTAATKKTHLIIGVTIAILMVSLLTIVATITLILRRRKYGQRKVDYDRSYSTLCRGVQQMQSQSVNTSNELYDQIQLSPSTGQAEFISRNETVDTNNPPPHKTEYDIHPSVDKDKPKTATLKITVSTISSLKKNNNTPEQPTYAVVSNKKKKKSGKESGHYQSHNTAGQLQDVMEKSTVEHGYQVKQSQDDFEADNKLATETVESLQDLYSVVKKKPKERPVIDDIPPQIPLYTIEELYTAVEKVPKTNTGGDEEVAPQIPPHTIDELYAAVHKKPKASDSKDEEKAPPIPAHTVEDLYSAVMKKQKVAIAEDEEEIPQVPPHIMEEL